MTKQVIVGNHLKKCLSWQQKSIPLKQLLKCEMAIVKNLAKKHPQKTSVYEIVRVNTYLS